MRLPEPDGIIGTLSRGQGPSRCRTCMGAAGTPVGLTACACHRVSILLPSLLILLLLLLLQPLVAQQLVVPAPIASPSEG